MNRRIERFLDLQSQAPPPIELGPEHWRDFWGQYMDAAEEMRRLWEERSVE